LCLRRCSCLRAPPAARHRRAWGGSSPGVSSPDGSPPAEGIPSSLHRPLHLPTVQPGGPCPTATGRPYTNSLFGGIALGSGPVLPLLGVARARDVGPAKQGVLRFLPSLDYPAWFSLKTLWFSFPSYQGPVFIRGRQLDGSHSVGIGDSPSRPTRSSPPDRRSTAEAGSGSGPGRRGSARLAATHGRWTVSTSAP
jgi:hypothetical protein